MVVHQSSTVERRRRRKTEDSSISSVYFSDGIALPQRKFMSAYLRWRYGIYARAISPDDAAILIFSKSEVVDPIPDKIVIQADNIAELKDAISKAPLEHQNSAPVVFFPPVGKPIATAIHSFLRQQLAQFAALTNYEEVDAAYNRLILTSRNELQFDEARKQFKQVLMDSLEEADYVIVSEDCGDIHVVIGAIAGILGKPVIAQVGPSSSLAAFADVLVARPEDLVSAAMTAIGL